MLDSFGLALADLDVTPTVRAAAWTPASLSSLVAWFDPSYGVYANSAAKFVAASSQDLRRQGTLGTNYNTDWSVSMWVNPANVSGFKGLFLRNMSVANLRIYLQHDALVSDGFAGLTSAAGFFASATWVHVTVTYQGTGDKKLRFYKNGSLNATSSAYAGSAVDNDASRYFYLGSLGGSAYHDGSIDSYGYWNRELSAADALALYNSGSGKTYSDLTTAEKVSLVSWYDFATTASLGTDAHGSNTLTNTNSVTCDAGIVAGACVADDPVYRWYAKNDAAIYAEQATLASRPLSKTNILNSLPAVRFDATDDRLVCTSLTKSAIGTACWIAAVVIPRSVASELDYYGWNNNSDYSPNYNQWVGGITSAGKFRTNGYDGTTKEAIFPSACTADTAYNVLHIFNGTNLKIYSSGTLQQSVSAGTPNINSAVTFKLGKQFYASNADVCELMVVSGTPSADDIANASAYLLSRWGV